MHFSKKEGSADENRSSAQLNQLDPSVIKLLSQDPTEPLESGGTTDENEPDPN